MRQSRDAAHSANGTGHLVAARVGPAWPRLVPIGSIQLERRHTQVRQIEHGHGVAKRPMESSRVEHQRPSHAMAVSPVGMATADHFPFTRLDDALQPARIVAVQQGNGSAPQLERSKTTVQRMPDRFDRLRQSICVPIHVP